MGDRLQELSHIRWNQDYCGAIHQWKHTQNLTKRLAAFTTHVKNDSEVWLAWLHCRKHVLYGPSQTMLEVARFFYKEAHKLEVQAAEARGRSWKQWASTTAMENGARLAHRFAKAKAPWTKPLNNLRPQHRLSPNASLASLTRLLNSRMCSQPKS